MPDWRSLYPFESHELQLDGWRYHYVDEGAGKPLVMVHGNPTWSFYWRRLIEFFRSDYRTVAPDHIGCGLSDKPQDYPYTLKQHRDNLVRLLEELDLQDVTLLVHDWGGAIGVGAALQTPERIGRLVLFNTAAFPPPYIPWRIRLCRFPSLGAWAIRRLNAFARPALWMATNQPRQLTPEIRAGLIAPYDSWENRVAVARFVADIPGGPRHPTWEVLEEIEAGLPRLASLPVQIIWGMKDWCFHSACLERFQKHFPHAQTHRMENAGHYVVEDAHEDILPLVKQFLQTS